MEASGLASIAAVGNRRLADIATPFALIDARLLARNICARISRPTAPRGSRSASATPARSA